MTKKIPTLFCLFFASLAYAQNDLNQLIKGSVQDANRLVDGYASPMLKAFGYGLNQGWYNTAKNHKPLGVDLTVSVSAVYIPGEALSYTVNNNDLQEVRLINNGTASVSPTGSAAVPSIFGDNVTPRYEVEGTGAQFDGAPGLDLKDEIGIQAMPVPVANLGIGLPKGFEVKFRFVPKISIGNDGEFDLFGVGVMHDVKQYIPGIKNLPFDLAGFVGYTRMNFNVDLDAVNGENQRAEFSSSATTIQALISKKIAVLTVYGGLGYNIANTKLGMLGYYDVDEDGVRDPGETDPVKIEAASSGPRATVGMRLKLAVFTFHGDYTLQKYNTLTVGFGISVR
ncbi:MAG: hypothetical protein MUC38_06520 [Cyclobacteriaceae bacterium]|jgi:hypothetical protein|nr:hypothetical protein [Cyclobacteriaceae bacterium]